MKGGALVDYRIDKVWAYGDPRHNHVDTDWAPEKFKEAYDADALLRFIDFYRTRYRSRSISLPRKWPMVRHVILLLSVGRPFYPTSAYPDSLYPIASIRLTDPKKKRVLSLKLAQLGKENLAALREYAALDGLKVKAHKGNL